jgi:hypothetical protein
MKADAWNAQIFGHEVVAKVAWINCNYQHFVILTARYMETPGKTHPRVYNAPEIPSLS